MRRAGRVRTFTVANCLPLLIHIYACITLTASTDYGFPVEIKLWDTGRTPIAHMVDVTNEFGLKVLAEHNFLNDNNIAFSPYGLMGILVALFEGVDGESSYQIQRGIQLPWNRNIMRIGFRDIHRTLKTYFVPEEGFLAGLALNNENVTFNDSYKKVLRFYGFDLDNDQLPIFPPQGNSTIETNTVPPTMSPEGSTRDGTVSTIAMTTANKPREETTQASVKDETTTNPNAETISDVDVQGSTVTTTASPSLAPNVESTTVPPITTTVQLITSESASTETTAQQITTTTAISPMTTESSTERQNVLLTTETETTTSSTSVTLGSETDGETISQQTSQATVALTGGVTLNNEVDNSISTSVATSTVQPNAVDSTTATVTSEGTTQTGSIMTSSIAETQQTEQISTTLAEMITAPDTSTAVVNESTLETLQRRKKSIVDFIFTNPPYMDDYLLHRSFDIPAEMPSAGFDDKMFLANGLKSVEVTYMHYDSIIEHAYLPHLEASAVRLPLDSDRYYLLVVLPKQGGAGAVGRLLARMARESDLSDVYAALRPRRVKGIVPSFTVKGHVTLTTDLQKLGIRDVFEPRQRDFTPMTRQAAAGVYVRSIEQAVSVAIRKYRPDDHKKNRYVTNREPVTFYATYPFLYFVMDASIHVSLMAGKMVDPLNSRIL